MHFVAHLRVAQRRVEPGFEFAVDADAGGGLRPVGRVGDMRGAKAGVRGQLLEMPRGRELDGFVVAGMPAETGHRIGIAETPVNNSAVEIGADGTHGLQIVAQPEGAALQQRHKRVGHGRGNLVRTLVGIGPRRHESPGRVRRNAFRQDRRRQFLAVFALHDRPQQADHGSKIAGRGA